MKLQEAIRLFLEYLVEIERSPATIKDYRKSLNKFNRYLCNRYNCQFYVEDVTAEIFEKYLQEAFGEKGYSTAYLHSTIKAYKVLFNFCFKKGYHKTDIANQVQQVRQWNKERIYLTPEEIETFIGHIDTPLMKAVAYTMYYAGLRIGECMKLTVDAVDFDKNCIMVKNHQDKVLRIVPINYKLREILEEYRDYWRTEKETPYFFATRTGKISDCHVNRSLKAASEASGMHKDVTCHILRHSFASNLVAKGIELNKLKMLLGHKSLRTTSIYLHSNMEELRGAVELIN